MADGRHLGKIAISQQQCDRSPPSTVNFLKSKMAEGCHLEIRKSRYIDNALTDYREIWHDYVFWHSAPYGPLKFCPFKIQDVVQHNFWATVCKTVRPMLSDRCLSVWRWCIVAKRLDGSRWNLAWGTPQPWPHSSPSPKGHSPQFSVHVYC